MDKEVVVQIYNGILLLCHKTDEILPFAATWMDLDAITLIEISETEDDYHLISLTLNM